MSIKTLNDACWSCRGCGDCCRGFSFGPVEPSVIAGLKAADIASQWAAAAESPWYSAAPDGRLFLTHRDGHCVFLQEDNLCAVHRLLGEAAKPWFCREYPFQSVSLPGGDVAMAVRADCGGLHESFADGEPVAPQAAAALALPRIVPRQVFSASQVVILPGVAVGSENWSQIEPHLLQHLSNPRHPEAAVSSTRELLLSMAGRPAGAADPVQHAEIMGRILQSLQRAAQTTDAPPPFRSKLAWMAQTLADLDLSPPMPALTEASQRYLSLVLRGEVLTRRLGTVGGLPAMLGLHLVEVTVARRAAARTGALEPADLGLTLPSLKRALHLPPLWAQIQAARPALEALFMTA